MKILAVFDDKNYELTWPRYQREAVREVIIKENKIAMVKSEKEGFYKFPGGGINQGESHIEALMRETREETGIIINPTSARELGMIHEIRQSIYDTQEIFDQKSYYYYVNVKDETVPLELDPYEVELGYKLEWTEIANAINVNLALSYKYKSQFLLREAHVLKLLLERDD